MAEFDYSKDIAPLKGNFFSNPRLTDRERESMRGRFTTEIAPLLDVHDRMNAASREKQREDLSYQRGLMELKQARKEQRDQRASTQIFPEAVAALDAAFADPKATVVSKAKAIADVSARYAPHIAKNPAFGVVLSGYTGRLDMEDAQETRKRAEKDAKKSSADQRKYDRANRFLSSGVGLDGVKGVFNEDGKIDDLEQDYLDDAAISQNALQTRAENERAATVAAGQQESALRARDTRIEAYHEFLDRLEVARPMDGSEGGDDSYDKALKPGEAAPFKLKAEDRARIAAALEGFHGIAAEELPTDDKELFAYALKKKYSLLNPALPKASPTAGFFK